MPPNETLHLRDSEGDYIIGPRRAFDPRIVAAVRPDLVRHELKLPRLLSRRPVEGDLRRIHALSTQQCRADIHELSVQELLEGLRRGLEKGDIVVVAGSPISRPKIKPVNVDDSRDNEPTSVAEMSLEQRIERALHLAKDKLPASMQDEFAELISPTSIGITIAILAVWIAAHGTPVGPAVDILLLVVGIVSLGWSVFEAVSALLDFIQAIHGAESEKDLDRAAEHLARAIALVGVAAFSALLRRIAGRTGGSNAGKGGSDSRRRPSERSDGPIPHRPKETAPDHSPGPPPNRRPAPFQPSRTLPTGTPAGSPTGTSKTVNSSLSAEIQRSLRRENETADLLAKKGYRVRQLDESNANGMKNPDFEVEGKIFDGYAPRSSDPDKIRKAISRKISSGQTNRVVINLDDSNLKPSDIKDIFARKPKKDLEEIIAIKNGEVINVFP